MKVGGARLLIIYVVVMDLYISISFVHCSVMNLLAEIYSQEEMMLGKDSQVLDLNEIQLTGEGLNIQENPFMLSTLAPRLWPFMRHTITSVRQSAIRTLVNLCLL